MVARHKSSWIKERLSRIGKNQSDLADALGVSQDRISAILLEKRRFDVSELPALSEFIDLPVDDILEKIVGRRGVRAASGGNDDPLYQTTLSLFEVLIAAKLTTITRDEAAMYAHVLAEAQQRSIAANRPPADQTDVRDYIENQVAALKKFVDRSAE